MRVLICGGRNFDDYEYLRSTLDAAIMYGALDITEIIHGDARGIDRLVGKWANETGRQCRVFRYGRSVGPRRNQEMIYRGKPELVIAFPGGRDTQDIINRAMAVGIPVRTIPPRDTT